MSDTPESRPLVWMPEHFTEGESVYHGLKRVLEHRQTQFQEMIIVESPTQGMALVLDGMWQSCQGDEYLYHEPLVQPACIAHGKPRTGLVLGGGEGATVRELLRWKSMEKVVMVDIDGEVVDACKQYLSCMHQGAFEDPRTEVIVGDALHYLDVTDQKWDIVVSDLSDPIEDGPSAQLFTKEYYDKIKRVLAPGGVLAVQAGQAGPTVMELHVRLVHTLKQIFKHVTHYTSHIPSYLNPWGFCICRDTDAFDETPTPAKVDQLLADGTTGGLRMLDGRTLLGLMQTPKYLREAVAKETRIFSLAELPKHYNG